MKNLYQQEVVFKHGGNVFVTGWWWWLAGLRWSRWTFNPACREGGRVSYHHNHNHGCDQSSVSTSLSSSLSSSSPWMVYFDIHLHSVDVSWPEIRHPLHQRDGQTGLSRLEIFIINSFIIAMITIVILIIEHPFHQRDEQTELGLEIFITIIIFTIVVFAIIMIICIIIDHLNRLSWIRTQNWNFSDFLKWDNWTTADVKFYQLKIEKMQIVCTMCKVNEIVYIVWRVVEMSLQSTILWIQLLATKDTTLLLFLTKLPTLFDVYLNYWQQALHKKTT